MFSRLRTVQIQILFIMILMNLACSGFFSVYWLKDNVWALDPNDTSIQWLADEDYRAIAASTAPEFKLTGDRTIILPTDPAERKAFLARFELGTPDGRWHGRGTIRSGPSALQTWLAVAFPTFGICVLGLLACRSERTKPDPKKVEQGAFAEV